MASHGSTLNFLLLRGRYEQAWVVFLYFRWQYCIGQIIAKSQEEKLQNSIHGQRSSTSIATIMVTIFWDFLILYQIFSLPQVKWCIVISNSNGMHEFQDESQNDLRLRILGIFKYHENFKTSWNYSPFLVGGGRVGVEALILQKGK